MRQLEDTPIPTQIKDVNSLHVHACVYVNGLFLLLSCFISRVLMDVFVGCQLCMGHAVDKHLLSLVQREVKGIIADLAGHDARLDAVKTKLEKDEEARREEIDKVLVKLVSMEKMLSEELLRRVEGVEQGLAAANVKVEGLGQSMAQLQDSLTKPDGKVEQLAHEIKSQRIQDVNPG